MKMYVGNLPFQTSSEDLKEAFATYGVVTDVHMPTDRETGRPRGFAFVTMGSKEEMVSAIKGLDGQDMGGRSLRINEAEPREARSQGGYGGGSYGSGGSGGGDRRGGGGDRRGGGKRW